MPASLKIADLVKRFENNRDAYLSGVYNETQLRREFIDPFFKELGWDVDNTGGLAEAYKDVIHEDAIKIGGFSKAPDYCFRIGGTRKFFVEAKKPSVNLKDDSHPAFQLRRYAWSAKLPLSILTDFEEFVVYDCRERPRKTDKPSTARLMYFTFREYLDRWDDIAAVFSREAILKGAFDKFAGSSAGKKGTGEVDRAFLKEIESWREILAKNIALRNPGLSNRELNYVVQCTINRIIFLRICEDRGIEDYGTLQALGNGSNCYPRLFEIFARADERYNSGLFHFRKEKDWPEMPDELSGRVKIDDKVLKDILGGLYYPESPYEFSVLPAEILGQVYEQFLGQVIHLTAGHHARIEEKPEVKKAGGVYYTPAYIVDYIVKNTVGKMLDGKTPRQAAKLRVLDPACGSGSFLIGAYQYLLDWHRDWYVGDGPEKWSKGKKSLIYQHGAGDWRLTVAEKKRILLNNIYGVDIDAQAVEVTKLSLLLKVLEGESGEVINKQYRLFHERVLPSLGSNIKCGNSLIGPDIYAGGQNGLWDDEDRLRVNPFDWDQEFPEIMRAGGFDAVIGNPPYVRQEGLGEFKEYFEQHYKVYHGVADLYAYFIERGISLLRTGGIFSYIVANKWMRANYGGPLRAWLKTRLIEEIVDFGDLPVFQKATTYPCILRVRQDAPRKKIRVSAVKTLSFTGLADYVDGNCYEVEQASLADAGWSLADAGTQALLARIRAGGVPLGEYVKGKIYYGIKTGLNEAFVIDEETRSRLIKEDARSAELIKPFLAGRDIKRYQRPAGEGKYLILMPRGWTREQSDHARDAWGWLQKKYPAIAGHLLPFAKAAEKRYDKGEYWWELRACDYYDEFEKPKIIVPAIVQKASCAFDRSGIYSNDKTSIIAVDDCYLLGILNSKVADFVVHSISSTKQGGYFEYKPMYISQIPIRAFSLSNKGDAALHDRMVALVEGMLALHLQLSAARTEHEKTALQRQIDATDQEIDQLVYQLYGLSDEEIKIVENSAKKAVA